MSVVLFAGGGTGGHLYPALAVAAELRAQCSSVRVHFVGARRGVEARVLPAKQEEHTLLPLEPLRRDRIWRNWRLLPAILRSAFGLARLFRRLRPRVVVGTGGYASGPACAWATLCRVPVVIQEQNSWPGLTTRWLSRVACQIHLGYPEARERLSPGRKTRVFMHGNPVRLPDRSLDRQECRARLQLAEESTVLLVVGGSQGARRINQVLVSILEGVAAGVHIRPEGLQLLWATGPGHHDWVSGRVAELEADSWVQVHGYLDDMPAALTAADMALSRAGAMATAELLAWGIPAVLVPLPTAAADHQLHNALSLEEAGAAVCVPEKELTPDRLWKLLVGLVVDRERREKMSRQARQRARPDAARQIALSVSRLLEA